jgi:hypothetical protein
MRAHAVNERAGCILLAIGFLLALLVLALAFRSTGFRQW